MVLSNMNCLKADIPFSPLTPGTPGSPIIPCLPGSPGGPMEPCVPFLPLVPFGPRLPRGPWTPFGPGGPGRQTLPGAMHNDFLIIEFTYFLIPSRTSCKPSKSLLFASKLRRTISFIFTRPARGKFSNNLILRKKTKKQETAATKSKCNARYFDDTNTEFFLQYSKVQRTSKESKTVRNDLHKAHIHDNHIE